MNRIALALALLATPALAAPQSVDDVVKASPKSDWQALDSKVHWDLHGLLLSPDFAASLQGGNYTVIAGAVWLLCDGGIRRSTDGGKTFIPTAGPSTLGSLSVVGVAIAGGGLASTQTVTV